MLHLGLLTLYMRLLRAREEFFVPPEIPCYYAQHCKKIIIQFVNNSLEEEDPLEKNSLHERQPNAAQYIVTPHADINCCPILLFS